MQQTLSWCNRIGMLLGFISFWLAAPEFIGEERLKSWEQILINRVMKHRYSIWRIVAFGSMSWLAWNWHEVQISGHMTWFRVYFPFIIWGFFLFAVIGVINKYGVFIVSRMANDSKVRETSFFVGAVLFTLSFLLQLISTF